MPPAVTTAAVIGPPAFTVIEPSAVVTLVRMMPSFSSIWMLPPQAEKLMPSGLHIGIHPQCRPPPSGWLCPSYIRRCSAIVIRDRPGRRRQVEGPTCRRYHAVHHDVVIFRHRYRVAANHVQAGYVGRNGYTARVVLLDRQVVARDLAWSSPLLGC